MNGVGAWNIRGLNRAPKQEEVRQVIRENNLLVCAILESHVEIKKLERVCANVCVNWCWSSNAGKCVSGTRIILGWNQEVVDLMVLNCSSQVIHTRVTFKSDRQSFYCSFVYASNNYQVRRALWHDLQCHNVFVKDKLWGLLGDFNAALSLEDSFAGSSKVNISMREFNDYVNTIGLIDVNSTGLRYTWTQKPKKGVGVMKKIDQVMCNSKFIDEYPSSHAMFQPYRISDDAPAVLGINKSTSKKKKPFKFFNFIADKSEFTQVVREGWAVEIKGHKMFQVVKKMRLLKWPMRKLLKDQGNLHRKVELLRTEVDAVQSAIDLEPYSLVLREKEATCVSAYAQAILDEERFLKQKSCALWLKEADSNTSYFHRVVKARNNKARIDCIRNGTNALVEGGQVPNWFVKHYEDFLGKEIPGVPLNMEGLFLTKLNESVANNMVLPIINSEVKEAMFSIGDDKAPDLEGYSASFFMKAWGTIGEDVCIAVKDFFRNGKLLKEINHTIIALLPKVSSPTRINDYRPISCCNVIYKRLSKIITNRKKEGLKEIVSENQSAFIPDRSITDNILLTQELMHNYHLNRGPPDVHLRSTSKKPLIRLIGCFGTDFGGIPVPRNYDQMDSCMRY